VLVELLVSVPAVPSSAAFRSPYGRSFRCAPAAVLKSGADVSVIVRLDAKVKTAISSIPEDAWTTIEYTDAVYDEQTSRFSARCHIRGPAGVSMA
jgi:hypothetical protein